MRGVLTTDIYLLLADRCATQSAGRQCALIVMKCCAGGRALLADGRAGQIEQGAVNAPPMSHASSRYQRAPLLSAFMRGAGAPLADGRCSAAGPGSSQCTAGGALPSGLDA